MSRTDAGSGRRWERGTDADGGFDEVAVQLVLDGYHMPLHGADRREAVRRMVARGVQRAEMARRLKLSSPIILVRWAKRHGIDLPPAWRGGREPVHWTFDWLAARRERHNVRRWKEGDFDGHGISQRDR